MKAESILTFDNHNSVNGMREFARAQGATVTYIPVVFRKCAGRTPNWSAARRAQPGEHNLFAYPAQSNFSGVQSPLQWIAEARAKGWDVLLDAAGFTRTNRLDLDAGVPLRRPVVYKIFGYPQALGACWRGNPPRQAPPAVVLGWNDNSGLLQATSTTRHKTKPRLKMGRWTTWRCRRVILVIDIESIGLRPIHDRPPSHRLASRQLVH